MTHAATLPVLLKQLRLSTTDLGIRVSYWPYFLDKSQSIFNPNPGESIIL